MEKSQELIGILQAISIVAKSLAAKLMQIRRWKKLLRQNRTTTGQPGQKKKTQPKRQRKAAQTEKKRRAVYLASGHRQEMRRMYSGMTVHRQEMCSLLKQPFRKLQQHRQQFMPMWMCACRRLSLIHISR